MKGTIVPKQFIKPIGLLTILASQLEGAIDGAIFNFFQFRDSDKGYILAAKFNTLGAKNDLLSVVSGLSIRKRDAKIDFEEITGDIQKFIGKRNKLIHGRWMGSGGTSALKVSYKAQGKLSYSHTWFYPEEVQALANTALSLCGRISNFFTSHPDWDQEDA